MKSVSKSKKQRLAIWFTRKCFPKYKTFIHADDIVSKVHLILLHNKDKFEVYTKYVVQPLQNITEDLPSSKRYIISFIRRLVQYYGNAMIRKRKSIIVDGKNKSLYMYCIVKV